MSETYIGLDIGGTKLLGILMTSAADVLARRQVATPKGNDAIAKATLDVLANLAQSAKAMNLSLSGIAVGTPGFVDVKEGIVIRAENLEVVDLHLKELIGAHFNLPICVFHDVKASAVGEARFGVGREHHDFAFLNLGTGVAVGLYLDGKIYHGATGKAGELGSFCLRPSMPGKPCPPQDRLEWHASGPALVRRAQAALARGEKSCLSELVHQETAASSMAAPSTAAQITPQLIGQAARMQDPLAIRVIDEVADILGEAVGGMIDLLDLDCVIVGGGVAQMGDIFLGPLQDAVRRYAIEEYRDPTPVLPSLLGADAGAVGAVAYLIYGG